MEQCMDGAHDHYRLFISAEPAAAAEYHIIPQVVLVYLFISVVVNLLFFIFLAIKSI